MTAPPLPALPRPLEAVLLDFDHTLTDFGEHVRWAEARPRLRAAYLEAGVPACFLDARPGSLSLYVAVGASGTLAGHALAEAQRRASAILDEFEGQAVERTNALAGARELVEGCARLGLRWAVVTSNSARVVRAILARLGLLEGCGALVGRDDVAALKPSPEPLLLACTRLHVSPDRTVYAGDSVGDIEAARAAGMAAVGLSTGLGAPADLRAAGALAVLDDLRALLAMLERACRPSPAAARTARRT